MTPTYTKSQLVPCSSNTSVLFYAQLNLTTSYIPTYSPTLRPTAFQDIGDSPFYAIMALAIVGMVYGILLVKLRETSDNLIPLKMTRIMFYFSLFGATIMTEVAYVIALLTNEVGRTVKTIAIFIILLRCTHIPGGYYITTRLIGLNSNKYYLDLTDTKHLLTKRNLYIFLFIILHLDNTNTAYLPWLSTKFSGLSGGYPDMFLYNLCVNVKTIQLFISVVIQIAALCILETSYYSDIFNSTYDTGFRALSPYTKVLLLQLLILLILLILILSLLILLILILQLYDRCHYACVLFFLWYH